MKGAQLAAVTKQMNYVTEIDDIVYLLSRNAVNVVEQPLLAKTMVVTNSIMYEGEVRETTKSRFIDFLVGKYFTSICMVCSPIMLVELLAEAVLLLGN